LTGRKTFQVPPLAFGKERIDRQARLAAAANAADRKPLPMWNRQVNIFQIVDADSE